MAGERDENKGRGKEMGKREEEGKAAKIKGRERYASIDVFESRRLCCVSLLINAMVN